VHHLREKRKEKEKKRKEDIGGSKSNDTNNFPRFLILTSMK